MQLNTESPISSQLKTDAQVAEELNVSLRTVIYWRQQNKLPYLRIGRSIRYRPESIAAMLKKLERGGI